MAKKELSLDELRRGSKLAPTVQDRGVTPTGERNRLEWRFFGSESGLLCTIEEGSLWTLTLEPSDAVIEIVKSSDALATFLTLFDTSDLYVVVSRVHGVRHGWWLEFENGQRILDPPGFLDRWIENYRGYSEERYLLHAEHPLPDDFTFF